LDPRATPWVQNYALVPKSHTTIIWTHVFEGYVVKCGYNNWHQKDM
jgi:hypothetical protein